MTLNVASPNACAYNRDMDKKKLPLYLGIALPILMVLFIAASIYIPRARINPVNDFLYTTGGNPYAGPYYTVEDNRVVLVEEEARDGLVPRPPEPRAGEPELFLYNFETDKPRKVSLEEARALTLNTDPISPDGYEIDYGRRAEGLFPFFFGSTRDYNTVYVYGENAADKLNIRLPARTYGDYFRFLGWVVE